MIVRGFFMPKSNKVAQKSIVREIKTKDRIELRWELNSFEASDRGGVQCVYFEDSSPLD